MIFFDILVYLAVAKIAVLLLEDAAYAVRGKQSPRRLARARHAAQEQAKDATAKSTAAGTATAPAGSGRSWAAADGYLAGLIEDATAKSRARRRRAVARKQGAKAVDGVFVDVAEDGRWHADCDLCGWSSRPYRIEGNAQGAGRDHTRTEHPDQYSGEEETLPQDSDTDRDPTESPAAGDGDEETRRPALRVIPGGAEATEPATEPASEAKPAAADPTHPGLRVRWEEHYTRCQRCGKVSGPTQHMPRYCPNCDAGDERLEAATAADMAPTTPVSSVVHTDDHTYCQKPNCPTCRPPRFGWRCGRCGDRAEGFASFEAAEHASVGHRCATPPPADTDTATPAGPPSQADVEQMRSELFGKCAHRTVREGFADEWCDNPVGADDPYCADHQTSGADAGDDQHHPAANPATGPSTTEQLKEMTVNLEATGPEEIRAAFGQAAESAGENAETIGGIAGVLTEAADRYEGLEMAASTVGHLRDAAEQFAAAQAALNTAQEELQAALADFNAKDGQVAEAVADAGGNVASKEVLVG